VTGYLDRLVARAAGRAPSGLTPRRRSRYEDAGAGNDGFLVVDAESAAAPSPPTVATREPSSVPTGAPPDERAAPATPPTRPEAAGRGDTGEARPNRAHDDGRSDSGATIDTTTAGAQVVAADVATAPVSVDVASARRGAPAAPAEAPSPSLREEGARAPTAVAEAGTVVQRAAVPDGVATTRLRSAPAESGAPEVTDADDAPAAWPLATSTRSTGPRRHGPTPATSEPVVVEVTIGRVEIRAIPDPAPAAAPRTSSAPPLGDYLRERAGAKGRGR
jgi:hypothetical protein